METADLKRSGTYARFFDEITQKADRLTDYAIFALFFIGIAIAGIYNTWLIAFGVGGFCLAIYWVTKLALPGKKLYQYVAAGVYAIFMAQFIYQMHGMFEMHFFAFVGSGLLMAYRNWRLQIPLLAIIAFHHTTFAWLQYAGNSEIYFTQLEVMEIDTFLIHVALAAVIIGINAFHGYEAEKNTLESGDSTLKLEEQLHNMEKNIAFAEEIRQGNLKVDYELQTNDAIGSSLLDMREGLLKAAKREEEEKFINVGIAQISDILRANMNNLSELAGEVISPLVKYLNANQGGFFIIYDKESDPHFELAACYAYERQKHMKKRIELEEGLIGAAYLERESIYMTEVPGDYVNIRSGLGGATPGCIFIVPMKSNDEIVGVLELASFQPFEQYQRDFVEKVCGDIAAMIVSTRVNEQTNRLLDDSKRMTEEMRAQEEEMRQNMEEMQATQEEMKRAQNEIKEKEANLNALINNSEDTIFAIDLEYNITVVNETLRKKYASSEISLEVGKNISEIIPAKDWQSWKERYDRCFTGERFNIMEERKTEDGISYNETSHYPIFDENGRVAGASVISRNVTDRITSRKQIEDKEGLLSSLINSTSDTYFAIDPGYKITMFNDALFDRMNSHGVELQVGANIFDLLPESTHEYWRDVYDRGIGGEAFSFNQERSVNDKKLFLEVYVTPIADADGTAKGAAVVSKDVTRWYEMAGKSKAADIQEDPYQKNVGTK